VHYHGVSKERSSLVYDVSVSLSVVCYACVVGEPYVVKVGCVTVG